MSTARTWPLDAGTSTLLALDGELWQYFRRRVQLDDDVARELTQKTWLSGRLFRGESTLRYYLFSVARRVLADWYRKLNRDAKYLEPDGKFDDVLDDLPALDSLIDSEETRRLMLAEIDKLPEQFRVTVHLRLAGLGDGEIAVALGISRHTVRSRVSRSVGVTVQERA